MKIGIVVGEASGDLLGSLLMKALQERHPDLAFVGIAGPRMQGLGAVSWFPMEKLAVRGYVEVLKSYREIRGIQKRLIERFKAEPPDVFIGVDAPDFNLALERALKKRGIPTVQYVSPQIWAWRGKRIHKMGAAVTKVLTLFPFEAALYEKAGIPVSYVGHPLADFIPEVPDKEAAREQIRMNHASHLIALLPGSRQTELDYHAELMIETARLVLKTLPGAHFLAPLATRETRQQFETALHRLNANDLPITVLFGHAQLALTAADAALIASGTATLEAALLKCPMVITYRMSPLTYWLMKRKGHLPYVGLPNVLAGEFIVPELLQEDATPAKLAEALTNLLQHASTRKQLIESFTAIHRSLKQDNAARICAALSPYISARSRGTAADLETVRA